MLVFHLQAAVVVEAVVPAQTEVRVMTKNKRLRLSQRKKLGGDTISRVDHLIVGVRDKEDGVHLSQVIHVDVLSSVPDQKNIVVEGLFRDHRLDDIGHDLDPLKRTIVSEILITVIE